MAITINGSGSISGISTGGYPDGSITAADLASTLDLSSKTLTLPAGSGGKILQVVSTTKTDSFETSSTTFVDVTGLSVSITPAATSSKILVLVHMMIGANWWSQIPGINLVRNSTNICQSTGGTSENATARPINYSDGEGNSAAQLMSQPLVFLDSPATTSATIYKIQCEQMSVNRQKNSTSIGGTSTITVMEVSG